MLVVVVVAWVWVVVVGGVVVVVVAWVWVVVVAWVWVVVVGGVVVVVVGAVVVVMAALDGGVDSSEAARSEAGEVGVGVVVAVAGGVAGEVVAASPSWVWA